jgi:ferredoxin
VHVTANTDRCCGAGQCVLLAPDVFDQRDEDGMVVLLDDTPPTQLHDAVRESATVCPAAAIRLEES